MNRLKSSPSCRICRRWLENLWSAARTTEQRESVQRQIDSGICDSCQRERQRAAVEFMAASDEMRLFLACLIALGREATEDFRGGAAGALVNRVKVAEKKCVALRMWTWERHGTDPERFRDFRYQPRGRTHADHSYE